MLQLCHKRRIIDVRSRRLSPKAAMANQDTKGERGPKLRLLEYIEFCTGVSTRCRHINRSGIRIPLSWPDVVSFASQLSDDKERLSGGIRLSGRNESSCLRRQEQCQRQAK
jgi:hypothetical protein